MPEDLAITDAQKALRIGLGIVASQELKILVEDRHLYQRVEIPFADTAQNRNLNLPSVPLFPHKQNLLLILNEEATAHHLRPAFSILGGKHAKNWDEDIIGDAPLLSKLDPAVQLHLTSCASI